MKTKFSFDFNSSNQTKIFLHVLVWLIFFSVPFYFLIASNQQNYYFLIIIGLNVILFYLNFSFLVPKFLINKRWRTYLFFIIFFLITYSCLSTLLSSLSPPPFSEFSKLPPGVKKSIQENHRINLFPSFIFFALIMSVSSFLKLYEIWNVNYKRQKEIENENRKTELNFLKSQLNPHFFFNSLNTIYSLSISKSEKTSEAILNLSELMRYMLTEKKDNGINKKVKLTDEISYITNYIELQKLRITENNKIQFTIEGNIQEVTIYPLLFISFIENAFKYGIHPIHESHIKIFFKVESNILNFEVENLIHLKKNSYDSFGLGNENSVKRLNLYYPNNKLLVESLDNKYYVQLKLNLDENENNNN